MKSALAETAYARGIWKHMEHLDYSYSAATQAAFYKAEAKLLRLNDRIAHSPFAKYLRETLLAIEAVFAIRISCDKTLPVVALVTAFDLLDWRYSGDAERCVRASCREFQFPPESLAAAKQALNYMGTIRWISENVHAGTMVTIETVLRLHEHLLADFADDGRYRGFRKTFLPYKKGIAPSAIPSAVNDLCNFINTRSFSPLGQASVVHHAFERIVPFDSLIDRTGLALSFLTLFKRGLFTGGFMVPICWGASLNREQRQWLRNSSRDEASSETYLNAREAWARYNARNTYSSVIITESFLRTAERLRAKWRAEGLHIPSNSALDRLLDLILGMPGVSAKRAAELIGKSYSATNEALRQLCQAGIAKEIAMDGRERIFVCSQSADMVTEFVNELVEIGQKAGRR